MAEDTDDHDAPPDMQERHTGQPRNVVLSDQGRGSTDVFFAAVRMMRMPSACPTRASPTTRSCSSTVPSRT